MTVRIVEKSPDEKERRAKDSTDARQIPIGVRNVQHLEQRQERFIAHVDRMEEQRVGGVRQTVECAKHRRQERCTSDFKSNLLVHVNKEEQGVLTILNVTPVGRAEYPRFVIIRQCAGMGEDGRRAGGEESSVVDRLDVHVVEDLAGRDRGYLVMAAQRRERTRLTFH